MSTKLSKAIVRYSTEKRGFIPFFRKNVFNIQSLHAPPSGGGPFINLAFDMQQQIMSNWCWAATATSVSIFYNKYSSWTQCSVAAATLSAQCCQAPHPCDKAWYLNEALDKTGNFIRYMQPLGYAEVEQEITAGRVIGCRVQWPDGKGHFVVIYGCRDNKYYSIDDPSGGKSETTISGFMTAYLGSGRWTHSFITKP